VSAALDPRPLGRTGLRVSPLCVGTSPFGMPTHYGSVVEPARAVATVLATFDSPITFLDTSNEYGEGEVERRIGEAVRARGGLPAGFVLETKVDPDPRTGDFSGRRVRASLEESLERLGLDRVPLLHLHDPERISFEAAMAPDGPVQALIRLRDEGIVDGIGIAGGPVDLITRYVETDVFDAVLTHNRFTLLDRSAEPLIDAATARGMGVLNAAVYGGGMLAKGPDARPRYAYGAGDPSLAETARRMGAACDRHGVPLAAAALQLSVREPRIHATVVGMSAPGRVGETLALLDVQVPDELWQELRELAPPPGLWIGSRGRR
jgi:D-threo-aldose 1-dehydrogenase